MPQYRTFTIDTTARLRSQHAEWDELWERSAVTFPTMRAACVAQWVEQFSPDSNLQIVVVADGDRWLAALPLVSKTWLGVVRVGDLPANDWSPCGDLLLDETCDVPAVMDALVAATRQLPFELLWIEYAPYSEPRWQQFLAALDRAQIVHDEHERYRTGRIEISHDWEAYQATWSKNHRKNMGRVGRRIEREVQLDYKLITEFEADDLPDLLQRGFAVEDHSWKGNEGSSVIRAPGMFDFFVAQARALAKRGNLALAYLDINGQPAGFAYGYKAKGTFHFFKWGYDESFHVYGPGQQLAFQLLKQFHAEPEWTMLDLAGPLVTTTAKWQPQSTYTLGRVAIAADSFVGRSIFWSYQNIWPLLRKLRGTTPPPPAIVEEAGDEAETPRAKKEEPVAEPVGAS